MHLFAINVVTAFKFIFAKGQANEVYIGKAFKLNKTSHLYYIPKVVSSLSTTATSIYTTTDSSIEDEPVINQIVRAATYAVEADDGFGINGSTERALGSFTKVFYTAVVEYNIIAAAVMFIVWHNIERIQSQEYIYKFERKNTIRIQCSKMIYGLFGGYAFLTGTLISMTLFYTNSGQSKYLDASNVYNYTDIIQHSVGLIACVIALWRIRLLNYQHHDPNDVHHAAHSNQGLFITQEKKPWQSISISLAAAHISRIVQAIFQCFLICIASKAKMNEKNKKNQPGKQVITFLIIVNISIFIMNLFESDKVGTSEIVVDFYGKQNWVFLVRTFSPLTVFYRFHSSVCLAEIWKNTYTLKKQH
uniref:Gustatory receptor n=1 Tax=Panagrolaimus sp. PS1159 TaxID=55785 RepID=A0AC35GNJ0_9BILA